MLIPKANTKKIYETLFNEGVVVAKKDFSAPKHGEIDVPNLHVIKTMQSLKSKNLVREQFAWRHYYWYLENEGIEYLRAYLHLPPEIVPATLKKANRPMTRSLPPRSGERGERGGFGRERTEGDRDSYRRATGEKKSGPDADFKPEFRGGYGRGRGASSGAPQGLQQE